MSNGEAGDSDGGPFGDVEDPGFVVAADGQQSGAGPFNDQVLFDTQLVTGQRDRAPRQAWMKDDNVAILGPGNRAAE